MRTSYRLVLMDRHPHPDFPELRVCEVTLERGMVVAWRPDTPAPTGQTQAEVLAMHTDMGAAVFLAAKHGPVRESELPTGEENDDGR